LSLLYDLSRERPLVDNVTGRRQEQTQVQSAIYVRHSGPFAPKEYNHLEPLAVHPERGVGHARYVAFQMAEVAISKNHKPVATISAMILPALCTRFLSW
jgi:hypothetical protein